MTRGKLSLSAAVARRRWSALCLLAGAALLVSAAAPAVARPVRIDAPPALLELITRHLETDDGGSVAGARDALRRLRRQIPELVSTEGYFAAEAKLSETDGGPILTVLPGRRFVIADVAIKIDGAIATERRQSIIGNWSLKTGAPFRQADWDNAKQEVLRRLLAREHPKAATIASEAEVDLDAGTVRLAATFDAGARYRFGEIRYLGLSRYHPDLIARYNNVIQAGAPYRSAPLLALQSDLQNAPYFSSVTVELGDDTTTADDGVVTAPLLVRVEEREPFQVGFGVGYSSNTRARTEMNFRSSDLFRRGWELIGGVRLEQLRQSTYADIFLPPDTSRYRYSVGGIFEHSDIQGLDLTRLAVGGNISQKRGAADIRLALNWRNEIRRPSAGLRTKNQALTVDADWEWRDGTERGDPDVGQSARVQIGGASKALLSDQDFVRVYSRYARTFRLSKNNTFTARVEGGVTVASSRTGIPQDFLFRTGGTNTVRGYAYQSLGVKEGSAIVGGLYFAAASAEVVHWLSPQWGAAAFVDAGGASDDRRNLNTAAGYGVGARWRSPVGVFAGDLAYGQRTRKAMLAISITVPFR